jgi:hypothetical protein
MMRWGFMSHIVWAHCRVVKSGRGRPHPAIFWTAISVAAVVFGAGHLGVVGAQLPLTSALVARTIVLNAVGGFVFGWLFWRRSLESAMVAHASGHVVFPLAAWAGLG